MPKIIKNRPMFHEAVQKIKVARFMDNGVLCFISLIGAATL